MARILIGSSNVYRFYKPELFKGYAPYKMVACTNMEVFRVALDGIEDIKGGVAISVIKNFLCKAARQHETEEGKMDAAKATIAEYLNLVQETALKRPGQKFALVQPTKRPKEEWYSNQHGQICKILDEGLKTIDLQNVSKIQTSSGISQVFEQDGVHLTTTSGSVFVNAVLFNAEEFYSAQFIDLETEMEVVEEYDPIHPETSLTGETIKNRITAVERELDRLNEDLSNRRLQDSMVTARLREEMDHGANIRKEDHIIITGLTSTTVMPHQPEEKKYGSKTSSAD